MADVNRCCMTESIVNELIGPVSTLNNVSPHTPVCGTNTLGKVGEGNTVNAVRRNNDSSFRKHSGFIVIADRVMNSAWFRYVSVDHLNLNNRVVV